MGRYCQPCRSPRSLIWYHVSRRCFGLTAAGTRAHLGPYLAATTFHEYRDLIEPVVAVSEDATLGWVIAQVYARGIQRQEDGTREPLEFTCAWIELYARREGRWLRVGNVSNFKE